MTCPDCGLALPQRARFCVRCGARLAPAAPRPEVAESARAPVWLLTLLWLGAAGLLTVAATYLAIALDVVPPDALGAGADVRSVRGAAGLVAACAASLSAGHLAAALGLMGSRSWGRTLTTMVCVVWALTCVGLPLGLLGISAMWRPRRAPL
ncbi:MAG TPA: zinc ribbon domain-containing protein [Candidatus Dormibacteraeota bacterium]|nr:zinc ribbon domain-containing protein [Candidatus Dormibacteraeota bacterium]